MSDQKTSTFPIKPTAPPPDKPCYKGLRVAVQWIPSDEMMPDDRTIVLVTNAQSGMVFLAYSIDGGWPLGLVGDKPVTHWAFLPPPPQLHNP